MCGRFTQRSLPESYLDELGVAPVSIQPRFNFAPTQQSPVVRMEEGERGLATMQWGLIPTWAKEPPASRGWVNARSETAHEKPSFRSAFKKRRCLIPADGFYEWAGEKGSKEPHLIERPGSEPFVFARLWESWTSPDGPLDTFTILTTIPNAVMELIHDRMPVILDGDSRDRWLEESTDAEQLRRLMRPIEDDCLHTFPVSKQVNNPRNDSPECVNGAS